MGLIKKATGVQGDVKRESLKGEIELKKKRVEAIVTGE